MNNPVILTGLRANNDLHIGNYFGALMPIVDIAKNKSSEYHINLFVPDLHSFTTPIDHSQLQAQIINNLKLFVAAGLPTDNVNVRIYRQSYIPAHSEMTWILDCFTSFGEMSRMTQFKDKSTKIKEDRVSVGLFNYPVLMAADVLLYGAEYVPVGEDQSQHIEFIRDIAIRMNNQFGDIFVVPKSVNEQHKFFNKDQGLRIKDLSDPNKKMSKSDETGKGIIFLGDDPNVAVKKIMSATTDSVGRVNFDSTNQAGITNLMQILALLSNSTIQDVSNSWQGKTNYGEFKQAVADKVKEFLTDFQMSLSQVNEQIISEKLISDETIINAIANERLLKVQTAVGLRS
jgi:tryptophanyl-tRNA synthetase